MSEVTRVRVNSSCGGFQLDIFPVNHRDAERGYVVDMPTELYERWEKASLELDESEAAVNDWLDKLEDRNSD